jgi:hypothetical protein
MFATRASFLFALPIFLGAFLFFQLELLYSKFLLPHFGGSSSVWITSMFTYQLLMLGGYAYAYRLADRPMVRAARIQQGVLILAVGSLLVQWVRWKSPLLFTGDSWWVTTSWPPALQVAGSICFAVGLPMLVLASTSPLCQAWFSRVSDQPYRLYAISNAGSLLGLLSYPLVFEPWLTLHAQSLIWPSGFSAPRSARCCSCPVPI